MTQPQVEQEALLQIIAGSDSTAISIRCTMLFLTTTPHAYRRLQEEIDQGIAEGKISSPITNAEAKALPYLQAVIHETRRYHPINIGTFPKVVPPNGDTLAGQFVPGGTKIAVNQRGLLRNKVSPTAYGPGFTQEDCFHKMGLMLVMCRNYSAPTQMSSARSVGWGSHHPSATG